MSVLSAICIIVMQSCGSSAPTSTEMEQPTVLTVEVEGMTCAMGCAASIQEKCAELVGVTSSEVNFDAKTGRFVYDAAKLKEADIIQCIENTNGGGIYKASVISNTPVSKDEPAPDTEAVHEKPASGKAEV